MSRREADIPAPHAHRPIASAGLHPCIAGILQLLVLYAMGALMTLCAYAGFSVTAVLLEVLPSHQVSPASTL